MGHQSIVVGGGGNEQRAMKGHACIYNYMYIMCRGTLIMQDDPNHVIVDRDVEPVSSRGSSLTLYSFCVFARLDGAIH